MILLLISFLVIIVIEFLKKTYYNACLEYIVWCKISCTVVPEKNCVNGKILFAQKRGKL